MEHTQYFPKPGHIEHDPEEIWTCVKTCIATVMEKEGLEKHNIACLGITNQRETTVIWNKHTGKPYHNAIVWNDTRTTHLCEEAALNKVCISTSEGFKVCDIVMLLMFQGSVFLIAVI